VRRRRRSGLLLSACLCLLAGTLACASAAFAVRPHEFKETFAGPCPVEPCEGAHLKEADGVGVNEASGDVYVVDRGAKRLVRFNEGGEFQSELTGPSATGSGALTSGSETVESAVASTGAFSVGEEISAPGLPAKTTITAIKGGGMLEVSQPATASELASLSAQQRFQTPETIAVDNSCVLRKLIGAKPPTQEECEAEDLSNGDVYVLDAGHRVVDKFSTSGEYLGQISEGAEGNFKRALDGVAVDQTGSVWVYQEDRSVSKYTNAVQNVFVPPAKKIELPCCGVPGFAIDSKGNFYGGHGDEVNPRIGKAAPSGIPLITELDSDFSSAVAVDQISDIPFVANLTTVAVFDPEGSLLERLGEEGGAKHLTQGAGIGVNAEADLIYAADSSNGKVVVFGPASPSAPNVESESVSEVTSDSASFGATISPRSDPGEPATTYQFEYGRCTTATTCQESGFEASVPKPPGQIPADFELHTVGAPVKGLQPNTTYHFRAIASNSYGEGPAGEVRTFTTQGAGGELVLPDNRGWELVSPPDKRGALIEPIPEEGVVQAAAGGGGITYLANAPTEPHPQGFTNSMQVLSRRSTASWSSLDLAIPHASATGKSVGAGPEYRFFDPELTLSVVQPFGEFLPALSEEASESTAYLHDLGSRCGAHCFRPLVTGKAPFANVDEGVRFGEEELCKPKGGGFEASVVCGPRFRGASDDLSRVVLESKVPLLGGAAIGALYEWSAGSLAPVSVLPGGGAAAEGELGLKSRAARRAISTNGSRIVWQAGAEGNLYQRDMIRPETVQLDRAEEVEGKPCKECESGGGRFQIASVDGSRIFFESFRRLTQDSGAKPSGGQGQADLYECRIVPSGEDQHRCELSDLTPRHGDEPAEVQGGVLGASEDGSYIYFVAKGVLSEGHNRRGQTATPGRANLYLRHAGSTSFIATLASCKQSGCTGEESEGDDHDWSEALTRQPARVSNDGQWLAFMSQGSPTGYDNRDATSGAPVAEVYAYDAAANRLSCASCEPTGVRPTGIEYIKTESTGGGIVGGPRDIWPRTALVAANVPGWPAVSEPAAHHQPRYLSNEGRLFFNAADALVPQDSNGTQDVYEYEPPGVGDCSEASATFSARSGGCVALISAGRSAQESGFLDASETGSDVFFLTSATLSPADIDTARDVYDAHVCTGSSPCIDYGGVQSPPCTTEASCKPSPTPQPSIFGAPASATFQSPGNLTPPPGKPKGKTAAQLRAEKLKKALKACRTKKKRHKRLACERQARRKYGPVKVAKTSRRPVNRRAR
jgi:hypothetical protein